MIISMIEHDYHNWYLWNLVNCDINKWYNKNNELGKHMIT